MLTQPTAAGTSHGFQHTLTTRASPEALWQAWTDVPGWPSWDIALEWARLDPPGTFDGAASGVLKGRGAPAARFRVVGFDAGASYTFASELPLGRLVVRRSMSAGAQGLAFTHHVHFEGPGGWLLGWALGPQYRRALPDVMQRLRARIEAP